MESIIHLDSRHNVEQRRGRRSQPPSSQQQVTSSEEGGGGPDQPSARHRQQHQHHRPRRRPPPGAPGNLRRSPDDAALDSALPSDSDHNFDHHSSEEELEVINSGSHPEKRKWVGGTADDYDDELGLLVCCPVQFRTSPPAHAHKPGKCLRQANIPPHELCSVSPRKRHRRTPTAIQRPCLDFEKMQQVMTRQYRSQHYRA